MSEVTLSVIGLSPQEGTVVSVAANLLAALDHNIRVLSEGDTQGDIVLISPAAAAGKAVLASLDANQRAVLFVDGDGDVAGRHPALTRPVRVQVLRDLLIDLIPRLPAKAAQVSKPSVVAPAPKLAPVTAVTAAASSLPANLFYLLLDTMLKQAMVRVEHDGRIVLIHGPSQCIYTSLDSGELASLSRQTEAVQSQKLSESDFMRAAKGLSLTRMHDLIWLAERHGSQGVLLPGHSADVPVRLKVWPKFNNRHVRPEYLKLAAMLSRQPLTLHALAESSGVALPQVIDFYNASVSFGVVEKMESAPVVTPPPKPANSSGLLGKIARKLALMRD
jgi:hypothetical protein